MIFGGSPAQKAAKLKERGSKLIADGRLDAALSAFEEASELNPDDEFITTKIAQLLGRVGRKVDAIRLYQNLADKHAAAGFLLKAIAVNKMILHLDPDHEETQETLAKQYAERGMEPPTLQRTPSTLPPTRPGSVAPASMRPTMPADMRPATPTMVPEHARPTASVPPAAAHLAASSVARPTQAPDPDYRPAGRQATVLEMPAMKMPLRAARAAIPSVPDEEDPATLEMVLDLAMDLQIQAEPPQGSIPPRDMPATPLFEGLPKAAFVELLSLMNLIEANPGDKIVVEGEIGVNMYIVASGSVDVVRERDGERLARLGEGAFFGEIALLTNVPRTASVVAAEPCQLLEIGRDALNTIVERHPKVDAVLSDFYRARLVSNLLTANPLFEPLSKPERRELASRFQTVRKVKGETLQRQGHQATGLYLLLRGLCSVTHATEDGTNHRLPDVREGEFFGEIALLLRMPLMRTVTTKTPCTFLFLTHDDLRAVLLPNKAVWKPLLAIARKRMADTASISA